MPTILIVEDDPKLAGLVSGYLAANGYTVAVEGRGDTAIERIRQEVPDVVVLDIALPGCDGFEVCRAIRPTYPGAILMLTARGDDQDEVTGIELGADDYMAKPVRPRVLLARIRGLLRRTSASEAKPRRIVIGRLELDQGNRTARWDGAPLDLTTAEYDLLWFMTCRAGQVLTRDALYRGVRGIPYDGVDRSIDLRVSRIRRKLGGQLIVSVRGTGYLLVADP